MKLKPAKTENGTALKRYRESMSVGIHVLAAACGITPSDLEKIEANEIEPIFKEDWHVLFDAIELDWGSKK
jgi:hypothetical protein